ncbi:MAG: YbaK/EbsC family protein [Desulfovibrio sp.]|nr:YbaK/EbsC family protein [Desulfovibrio sp.]
MDDASLSPSARRVQDWLDQAVRDAGGGYGTSRFVVRELSDSTRTAQEAADAVGCTVAQIAKSLIFKGKQSGRGWLIIASGANRVDEKRAAALAGEPLGRADADFVRQATGYAIGGVPPVGHATPVGCLIDADLLALSDIWAAAGTPHAVFPLTPDDLVRLTGGTVGHVRKE